MNQSSSRVATSRRQGLRVSREELEQLELFERGEARRVRHRPLDAPRRRGADGGGLARPLA